MGKKDVHKLDNSGLRTPVSAPTKDPSKIHVDLYLTYIKVPMWERGGKRAFAIAKGMEYASYDAFIELFQKF